MRGSGNNDCYRPQRKFENLNHFGNDFNSMGIVKEKATKILDEFSALIDQYDTNYCD